MIPINPEVQAEQAELAHRHLTDLVERYARMMVSSCGLDYAELGENYKAHYRVVVADEISAAAQAVSDELRKEWRRKC